MRRLRTAAPLLAALLTGLTGLTGCGIRATEVPTEFGPAPSRVRCSAAEPEAATRSALGLPVQVFLLCGSSLVAVDRSVSVGDDGTAAQERRIMVAQELLNQLASAPSAAENEAGYSTTVRDGMTISGPRRGDPDDTLRLSYPPDALGSTALAQIVCTFSDSAAAEGDGSVILGGPDTTPLRSYECTDEVRSDPAGTKLPSTEVSDS